MIENDLINNFKFLLKTFYLNNSLINKCFIKQSNKNFFKLIFIDFLSFFNRFKFFGRKIKKNIYLIKLRSLKNNKFFNRIFYSVNNRKKFFDQFYAINKFIKFIRI